MNTTDIGIMRIDITASCRSRVLRSRSARPASSGWLAVLSSSRLFCASMAWVMTSSPTRLISWSTLLTDTRSVLDSGEAGLGARASTLGPEAASGAAGAGATTTGAVLTVGAAMGTPGAPSKKPKSAPGVGPGASADWADWADLSTIWICSLLTWNVNRSIRSVSLDVVCTR
ncbi:hypothetical protein D9M68_883860 [compost metagenome]